MSNEVEKANQMSLNQDKNSADKQLLENSTDSVNSVHPNYLTPGELLKKARVEKDLAIATIAKQLKLDLKSLESLERNDFESIGAPVFVKGHLRKYASLVGIEHSDIMFAYHQVARSKDAMPVISQNVPMTEKRPQIEWVGKLISSVLVLAIIAALIYGVYQFWNWYIADAEAASASNSELNMPAVENTVSLPVRQTSDSSLLEENMSVGSNRGNNSGDTNEVTPEGDIQADTHSVTPEGMTTEPKAELETEPSPNADTAQTVALSLPNNSSTANQSVGSVEQASAQTDGLGGDTLLLVFNENCWVRIKDEAGKNLMNGIALAGNQRTFSLLGQTDIELGNADGVSLFLNGSPYQIPAGAKRGNKAVFRLAPKT